MAWTLSDNGPEVWFPLVSRSERPIRQLTGVVYRREDQRLPSSKGLYPHFQARTGPRKIRGLYARRPAGGRRLCVDEFGPLNLQPRHGGCWACEGKVDRLRATYHRHSGVRHMFGLYVLETNRLWGVFAAHKTWRDFLAFLKWVRRRYPPHETLHIVLDNYKPHLRTEVLDWAAGARSTLGATCRMKPYASTLTLMKETTRSGGLFLSYWPNGHFFQNAGLLN